MKKYAWLLLLWLSSTAWADSMEVFSTYTGISQATGAYHLQLGLVDPIRENFGIRYEYAYARFHDRKNDWHADTRDSVDVTLHSFMLGAQQDLGHTLIAFSGLTYSVVRGSFNLENREMGDQNFTYEGLLGYIQSGFGNRWKWGNHYSVGIDWLVFSIYFSRQLFLHDAGRLRELKGSYYPKQEIKNSLDSLTAVRALGIRLSIFL
jgi:hypothetical protein